MKQHIRAFHKDAAVTESQEPLILEACERDQRHFPSSSCPLCDAWDTSPSATEGAAPDNANQFYRHLGHHLQVLALEALPLYIEGLDIQDGNAGTDQGESEPTDPENDANDDSGAACGTEKEGDDRPPGWPPHLPASTEIGKPSPYHGYVVLHLAASLFEFWLESTKLEAGYPCLTYAAGEVCNT